ncbi:MAG: DUF4365 domain-containing protein [Gammaproteobacteria bacterium]
MSSWKHLNRQQVGAYAEYYVKMEFTRAGFQVFSTEVDDRGIDFVAKHEKGKYFSVQVKSIRGTGYVFMAKEHFEPAPDLYVAIAVFEEEENRPSLFLVPSEAWLTPTPALVDRDYEGLRSKPEFGVNLSSKHMKGELTQYEFAKSLERLRSSGKKS